MISETPFKYQLIPDPSTFLNTLVFLKIDVSKISNGEVFEISAIAVHVNELSRRKATNPLFPRIIDKLTLCFNPESELSSHISAMTKLDLATINSAGKPKFDKRAVNMLRLFLQRQEGPICFISHNGFHFDFPILQGALALLGCNLDRIDNKDVLCGDSMWTFKTMDDFHQNSSFNFKNVNVSISDMVLYSLESLHLRYLKKQVPEEMNAEKRNLALLEVVCNKYDIFMQHLCCTKFESVESGFKNSEKLVKSDMSTFVDQPIVGSPNFTKTGVFVFVDIETTSLKDPQITELCLIAVHSNSLATPSRDKIPRIQDKLLFVIEPNCPIEGKAAGMSGLNNELIQNSVKSQFDRNIVCAIAQFLEFQSSTICLVAHYGRKFDFPHIMKYLRPHASSFPILSKVFCADSLEAIQSFGVGIHAQGSFGSRVSNKLKDVYERYFPNSKSAFHTAEGDVNALIQICCAEPTLLEYLDSSKIPIL